MALPPTALTTLLSAASTPTATYAALRAHRCLSLIGLALRGRVVDRIAQAIEQQRAMADAPGWTGPTAVDVAAAALIESPYLSGRGRRLQTRGPRSDTTP